MHVYTHIRSSKTQPLLRCIYEVKFMIVQNKKEKKKKEAQFVHYSNGSGRIDYARNQVA
jgi:phosphomannomutase